MEFVRVTVWPESMFEVAGDTIMFGDGLTVTISVPVPGVPESESVALTQ